MCLISCAPKGTDKYSDKFINAVRRGATNNKDGYGYMFKINGDKCVFFDKTFNNIEDLLISLESIKLKVDDELVIHSRSGNKGAKTKVNAHPFILTDNVDQLNELAGFTFKPMMCHNGTFKTNYLTGYDSDTYMFVRDFMCIPEIIALLKRNSNLFNSVFKDRIDANKLVYLFPDADMIVLGKFEKDDEYLHSNISYKDTQVSNVGGVNHSLTLFKLPAPYILNITKNNPFGISVNEFTKDEIYLVADITDSFIDQGEHFIINPYKTITKGEKAFWVNHVSPEEAVKTDRTINKESWSTILFKDDLINFTVKPALGFETKYTSYALLKQVVHPISNKKMKKLFKVYNNSFNKTTVSVKINNTVYFILRDALKLFLYENYEHYKNCSNYVGVVEKETQQFLNRNRNMFLATVSSDVMD